MISWPMPFLPAVPGESVPVSLYDPRSNSLQPLQPGETARTYACGITPYDSTHLGHAATYLMADLLHRALIDNGHRVLAVQNITDIDDPLLERAARDGIDWQDLADDAIALFRDDMTALAVIPPQHYLGVVESMDTITASIRAMIERGLAYSVTDESGGPDLYLDLGQVEEEPGLISGLDLDAMLALSAERGGDPGRTAKRGRLDPLLWRSARPGEPCWDGGPGLGAGRPGWHIECTALAIEHLGTPFDVQFGGLDLIFPHHEMSALQSTALTGEHVYADHYVYQALVGLDGAKMSKSLGNLVFVSVLREAGVDPMAIRALVLAHHYRTPWEFTDAQLAVSVERVSRWREALSVNTAPDGSATVQAIRTALGNDLDSPAALEAVDRWAELTLAEGGDHADAPGIVARALDALLGLRL